MFRNGEGLFYGGPDYEQRYPFTGMSNIDQPRQCEMKFLGIIHSLQDFEHISNIRYGDVFIYKNTLYTVENVTFYIDTMKTRIYAVGVDENGGELGITAYAGGRYPGVNIMDKEVKDGEEKTIGHYPSDMGNEEEDLDPSPELDAFLNEFSVIGGTYEI